MPVYLLTTLRRRGLMVRSDWRVTAALQLLSLSHYNVIIPDTSLWVKCFSFVLGFFLFGLFSFLWGYFFFQVDESTSVRSPFSYEHLSRRVYYSWRPITPDWRSSPLKMRSGDGWGWWWGLGLTACARRTCADHCILGDGLLLCSDITTGLKGF